MAERDVLQAAVDRVKAALKSEQFDIAESALCIDGVIEVADVEKALNGPTEQERLEAEVELHRECEWSDAAEDVVCTRCKTPLGNSTECPSIADLEGEKP